MAGTDRPLFPDSPRPPRGGRATPGGTRGAAPGGGSGRPPARPATGAGRPRRRWLRRTLLGLLLAVVGVGLLGVLAVVVAYVRTPIPDPNDAVTAQTTTIFYADGVTELGSFAAQDRTIVGSDEIPDTVRQAVVAAEDRSFYDNPGISPTGIARAAWGIVTGEPAGGGSTITQQYVKNYFLTSDQTFQRKFTEILISLKVERALDKDQILTDYLNTVYFGRGSYGVQAAAQAYFGVDAAALTVEQAALLAGVLPAPNRYDPAEDPEAAQERFDYVTDGLVVTEALTQAEADALVLPATVEQVPQQVYAGPRGYLLQAAREELVELGYDDTAIDTGGLRVVTTYDPAVQAAVEAGVAEEMPSPEDTDGEPLSPGLRVAAVSIDPATGGIKGMYGGDDLTQRQNAVTKDIAQGGSTFKPFTLVAALEAGVSLEETFNGNSGREFEGYDRPVTNFGGIDYGTVDLLDATADSVNTAYVELNTQVGPAATRDVAIRAGLPDTTVGLDDFVSNVLGAASPRPVDMAQVMATYAAQGVRREWHVVGQVVDPNGAVAYEADTQGQQVFAPDVMANATYAMTQVVERGSGEYAQRLERPVAGKTGTSTESRSAWFTGFTPQLATVVAMYQQGPDGQAEPIVIPGTRTVTGGSYPVRIWTRIMEQALDGAEVLEFPEPVEVRPSARPTTQAPSEEAPPPAEPSTTPPPEVTLTVTEEPEPTTEAPPPPPPPPSPEPSVEPEPTQEEPPATPPGQDPTVLPPGQGRAPVAPAQPVAPGGGTTPLP